MCDRNGERGTLPCAHLPAIRALKWTQGAQWEWVVNDFSESLIRVQITSGMVDFKKIEILARIVSDALGAGKWGK